MDPELHRLSREECLELLDAHHVGRIALLTGAAPVIVPVNYRLTGTRGLTQIALRTRFGGVIERSSPEVAFEIDHVDDDTRTGWSVLVRGTLHHLDPEAANFDARFDSDTWLADRDAWMIIQPYSIEGRKLTQPTRPPRPQ